MQNRSLRTPSPDPRSYPRKFLNGNTSLRASGGFNDVFRNTVIRVISETGLLARKLFQFSFCAATAILLQFGAQAAMAMPDALNGGSAVGFTVAGGGDYSYTKINADKRLHIDRIWRVRVADCGEIEVRSVQNKITLSLSGFQQIQLARTGLKRNLQATIHGPDGDDLCFHIPRENPVIVGDGPELPELPLDLLVEFIGVANLADAADGNLGRQSEFTLCVRVAELMDRELTERFCFPCPLTDPVATGIGSLHRVIQRGEGFWWRNQFDFSDELHYNSSIEENPAKSNPAKTGGIHRGDRL